MSEREPPWNKYQLKFKREWICLTCDNVVKVKLPRCPKCHGYLIARITKIKG